MSMWDKMTEYNVQMNDFMVNLPDKLDYYDDFEEIIRLIKIEIKERDHGFKYEEAEWPYQKKLLLWH